MRFLSVGLFVLFAAGVGTPCKPLPQPTPRPTPVFTAIPLPVVTPMPPPLEIKQGTIGSASLLLSGVDGLPLSANLDNLGVGVMTWETEGTDRTKPVIELSIRGKKNIPCLRRPCDDDDSAGLIVRYSANLAHDSTLDWSSKQAEEESQKHACGQGNNYHYRLALGPADPVHITVEWDRSRIMVKTPVDGVEYRLSKGQLAAVGSLGFGRFIEGIPWPRNQTRSWLWDQFSATRYGAKMVVEDWEVTYSPLELLPCPS